MEGPAPAAQSGGAEESESGSFEIKREWQAGQPKHRVYRGLRGQPTQTKNKFTTHSMAREAEADAEIGTRTLRSAGHVGAAPLPVRRATSISYHPQTKHTQSTTSKPMACRGTSGKWTDVMCPLETSHCLQNLCDCHDTNKTTAPAHGQPRDFANQSSRAWLIVGRRVAAMEQWSKPQIPCSANSPPIARNTRRGRRRCP